MTVDHPFLTELEAEANRHDAAEAEFRRTMRERLDTLARERAFAFRRLNVSRSLFQTVRQAESREIAVAGALAALRQRLGWREDSEAREEVLARYAAVAGAAFDASRDAAETASEEADPQAALVSTASADRPLDPREALAGFEHWYEEARGKPFWVLFEHYMPETQLVDF